MITFLDQVVAEGVLTRTETTLLCRKRGLIIISVRNFFTQAEVSTGIYHVQTTNKAFVLWPLQLDKSDSRDNPDLACTDNGIFTKARTRDACQRARLADAPTTGSPGYSVLLYDLTRLCEHHARLNYSQRRNITPPPLSRHMPTKPQFLQLLHRRPHPVLQPTPTYRQHHHQSRHQRRHPA